MNGEYACDYLARVGYAELVGSPTWPDCGDDADADERAAAEAAARAADMARVRGLVLSAPPSAVTGMDGVRWLGRRIDWPDRVPGLKTWAGQAHLPGVIRGHQRRLTPAAGRPLEAVADLFAARGVYRTGSSRSRLKGEGEGPSGIDPGTCPDPIDVGFSPAALGMEVVCRPGVELLAVVGLACVPLVSFGRRECGFLHAGRVWRFGVEPRAGGYFFRWGALAELRPPGDG